MNNQKYVCLGSCQAVISQDKYDQGLKSCGNDSCELKGKSFAVGDKCEVCRRNYPKAIPHNHSH